MRVLITGSSGRIGGFVAERVARKHTVIGLDVRAGAYTTVLGDITNRQLVEELCAQADAVIHTASLHAPHVGVVPDSVFRETNVIGTRWLLDASLRGSVKRFVYTSTTSLYGAALIPTDRAVWVTEELTPHARDIYDETKVAAEVECAMAARAGLVCVSLRMSRCFPEPDHLMAIYRLYRGVDPRDVAQAHELALTANLEGFHVFNISASSPFKAEETIQLLADAPSVVLKYFPWAENEFAQRGWQLPESIDRVYVVAKAQAELGYQPAYNFPSLFQ